jgi:hypothetical protein
LVKTARPRSAMPLTSMQSRHGDLIRRLFNAETTQGLDKRMLIRGRVEWLVRHRRSRMQAQSYRSPRTTQARAIRFDTASSFARMGARRRSKHRRSAVVSPRLASSTVLSISACAWGASSSRNCVRLPQVPLAFPSGFQTDLF